MKRIYFVLVLVGLVSSVVFGQEAEAQFDPNSTLRIPRYEHLYKVRIWREVDLREKQNKGFFAVGNEITKLVLNSISSGELADVYANDSLVTKKSKADLQTSLIAQQADPNIVSWDPNKDYYPPDRVIENGVYYEAVVDSKGKNPSTSKDEWTVTNAGKAVPFLANQIYKMTVKEDVIFDKRRSRLYYDILAIGFEVFDDATSTFKSVGWFRYKDLEKIFRNHPDEAIWFNRYNTAENKNYADAFLLRLFKGVISKIENPDDNSIFDVYANRKEAILAMEWEEMKMMEREHNLWEY
jgi:gliding motility associated protien GldN